MKTKKNAYKRTKIQLIHTDAWKYIKYMKVYNKITNMHKKT